MKGKKTQPRQSSPQPALQQQPESVPARPEDAFEEKLSPWTRTGAKLFLLGFATLFLELFFIRYLAGSIWNLGYFPNLVLLSVFIGMGLGFVFHHWLDAAQSAVGFQISFGAAVALILFVSFKHPIVPGFDVWHYNLDGDLYFAFVPFKADDLNYVFFILCFVMVMLIFACLSQRTAKLFRRFAPLNAYTLDILGSCAGIITFIIISALQLPAYLWFGIFTVIFVCAMPTSRLSRLIPISMALAAIGVMFHQDHVFMRDPKSTNHLQTYWSPYQRVEYVEELSPQTPSAAGTLRRRIFVNGLDHQEMHVNLQSTFYPIPYLYREKAGLPRCRNVLVIGAGSGNDVAAALQFGAAHVDAVEIDPVIARLGREHNPSRAYSDPRVDVWVDDGRAFMTRTRRKYDLIIFALTDSLVKVSSLSQLRLENYLFTRESVERAYELLEESGNLVFYNFYRLPFVADRIQELVGLATGSAPKILAQQRDFYMVCGEKRPRAAPSPFVSLAGATLPTDDWPFLYLENRGIPKLYLKAMGGVFGLITALLAVLHLTTRANERRLSAGNPSSAAVAAGQTEGPADEALGQRERGLLPLKIAFALMGVAFLLLETKSVIQFSLLFGTTWLNNSLIFLGVLVSVLAANWTVQWLKPGKALWVLYVLLVVSALVSFVFPLHQLLHIQTVFLRFIAATVLTLSPIYFANLIFSSLFRDQQVAEHIFGWNLLGATFGGILEYSSMALGYNALSLMVVGLYTMVFLLLRIARARPEIGESRQT